MLLPPFLYCELFLLEDAAAVVALDLDVAFPLLFEVEVEADREVVTPVEALLREREDLDEVVLVVVVVVVVDAEL